MKKILILFSILILSSNCFASINPIFGVKFDNYGGSIYLGASGSDGSFMLGIGQFRDEFKFEIGYELNNGISFKLVKPYCKQEINIFPYYHYKNIEIGFYTNYQSRYYAFNEFYGFFGVDYKFLVDTDFKINVKEKF